ncbi:MAG TPA: CCA tRNA nucleotidyltransferase [Candidatus Acidoferrales bacterium]|nr:CCA tRNA nucleotidyltransferase [Candidatus Acidoferrales bacterium]
MAYDALTKQILQKITPKPEERTKINALSHKLEQQIAIAIETENINAIVRVEGSIAKDTYLSQNTDIDIFMRLPTSIPRKNLGDIALRIAKKAAGDAEQIERFAEHPYLEIFIDNYRIDIVPCYDTTPGEWQSATDRTPYHTDYIQTHLAPQLLDEVRLLKKFMQGIGVYGAEIKIGGFSGYLCELLVMKYGSFAKVIEAFSGYSKRIVIDIENVYSQRERELELLFPEPLVIVDPVDKGRNVASAVQTQKLYEFIAASRAFQKAPSEEFFYPSLVHAVPPNQLEKRLEHCCSSFLFLVIGELTAVPDILWGQLCRTKRSLRTLLETNDYKVLRDTVWSNENALNIFVFELEQTILPNVKKHLGPQLERQIESENFLAKYTQDQRVHAGPYIEDGRWIVQVARKNVNAAELFKEKLADGGKNAGVAELVAKAIVADSKILVNSEVLKVYVEHADFAVAFTAFIDGQPFWLKTQPS